MIEKEFEYLFWYIVVVDLFSSLIIALYYLDIAIKKICNYLDKNGLKKKEKKI